MNCKGVESRLSAYLDGELTGHEMLAIRQHLSYCSDCRQEESDLRALKRVLCGLGTVEPCAGFECKLTAAVLSQRPSEKARWTLHPALIFAGVAGCTMFATLQYLGSTNTAVRTVAPEKSVDGPKSGIAFEVRHDEMTSAVADPISGSPVWSASDSR